jgi:hypothetical protein
MTEMTHLPVKALTTSYISSVISMQLQVLCVEAHILQRASHFRGTL